MNSPEKDRLSSKRHDKSVTKAAYDAACILEGSGTASILFDPQEEPGVEKVARR
jgi:hypothetical protein